MNKMVVALAAFFAIAILAPAARAQDCDPDEVADIEKCVRGVVKAPSLRQLPPAARPSAAVKKECDPDDEDFKDCLRGLKVPRFSRRETPDAPPAAAADRLEKKAPDNAKKPPDKVNAAPGAAIISSTKPAKTSDPDEARRCQKYFPSVGRLIAVPCSE